jgi:hypothetical protein
MIEACSDESAPPSRKVLAAELNALADEVQQPKTAVSRGSGPAERIRIALGEIDYMTNAVAAWVDGHAGNRDLASTNAKKVKQAEQLLGEVLASLPGSVRYTVYGLEGFDSGPYKSADDLIAALKRVGIRLHSYSSSTGRLRPELKGQPQFSGLVGPMYDGPGIARYETGELYKRMSQ